MQNRVKPKPLTTYYGGKSGRMAEIIVGEIYHIPHEIYAELYFGQGAALLTKPASRIEIANDLSEGVVTLLRVVRDENLCSRLIQQLELTPYARSEWNRCCQMYNGTGWQALTDPVEKARIFYVLLSQSFNGTTTGGGWSFGGVRHNFNVAKSFYNSLENIKLVAKRLQTVQLECQDALTLLKRWDSPDTLFYLDPPYLWGTRGQKSKGRQPYQHEMTDTQHQELLEACLSAKGKIILSGYYSLVYDLPLVKAGWTHKAFEATATSAVFSDRNGLKGRSPALARRVEYLWFNPASQTQRTLWSVEGEFENANH